MTKTTMMKIAVRRYAAAAAAFSDGQGTAFLHSYSQTSQNPPAALENVENRDSLTYILSDFNRMLKSEPLPSIFEFCKVLTKLSSMGHHSEVLSLYREMSLNPVRVPINLFTFNVVINSCCRLMNGVGVDYGLSLSGAMVKNGFDPDIATYTHLIKGLFSEKRNGEAIRLLRMLNKTGQPLPSIFELCKVLTNMSRMGHHSKVLSLYREMSVNSVPFNMFTYNVVINSCCRLRNGVGYGFSLLGAIVKHGYQPDTITFSHLIKGLLLEGRSADALRLFRTLTKFCKPDVFTYGIVINGLCMKGDVGMAIEVLRDMKVQSCDPNTVIYGAILDGLCKTGRVDVVFSLVGEMVKEAVTPDNITFGNLIKGLFLVGAGNAALKLFYNLPKIMRDVQRDQITYGIVIDGLCKMGNMDAAVTLFKYMSKGSCNPDKGIYTALMNGLCKNNRVDEAFILLKEMTAKGILPNVVTYSTLIKGLCVTGKLQEAWELFNYLPIIGIQPNVITYTIMIHGLCQEGFLEEAKELLAKMEENGCKPDDVTFNTIICGFLKWNQRYDAVELIMKMVERKFSPSASTISKVVNLVGANQIMK